ncbi:MAG TPA: hypothetical protein VLK82_12490 [Candidatus Tectomicrobia bacterium]|nr:hypothetical protein [Candidatus Tectomicrobia bacterium]
MGKYQRRKGAAFEREVLGEFSAALGEKFNRLLGQARDGGADGKVRCLRLEMKRRSQLAKWYTQAVAAAKAEDIPVVVMREDHGESMALISLKHLILLTAAATAPDARRESQQ